MITIKAGSKVLPFRRCISTTIDPSMVLTSSEKLERVAPARVVPDSHLAADIPKEKLVRDMFRLGRLNFKVNRELVTQTFQLKSDEDSVVPLLKVNHYLSLNQIELLLEEIDSILVNSPYLLKKIPDLSQVFIKANASLRLRLSLAYSREKSKLQLSALVKRLITLYSHLLQEQLLNSTIMENFVETLVANNRGSQLLQFLQQYLDRNSTINLVNLQIKLAGDGNPELWVFPTGKTLKRDRNLPVRESDKQGSYDCMNMLAASGLSPNLTTIHNLLLVIGKSQNLKLLNKIVEDTWGLHGKKLTKESVLYPNQDTLVNLIYCYAYNNEFLTGVKVMGDFMKIYKFKIRDQFWFQLFNTLSISMPKSEHKFECFNSLWKFMNTQVKTPGWQIYSIRLTILKEFNNLSQIVGTIPEVYEAYKQNDEFATRLCLKQYMALAIKLQSQKNLHHQSEKLVQLWSPDLAFKEMMDGILLAYYTNYMKRMEQVMVKRGIDSQSLDIDDDDDDGTFASFG